MMNSRPGALLICVCVLGAPQVAVAQSTYQTVNASSSILPRRDGFLNVELVQAKFGLTFVKEIGTQCELATCPSAGLVLNGYATAAARKGQNGFTNLEFIPGFELGGRVGYVVPHGGAGYTLLNAGAGVTTVRRKAATFNPLTDLITLSEPVQRDLIGSLGINHAFSRSTIVGVGGELRRQLESPGLAQPEEICSPARTGGPGAPIDRFICSDRYLDVLRDLWTGQVRADASFRLGHLGGPDRPLDIGLLTALSVDIFDNAGNAINVAIGPSLLHRDFVGHTLIAVLFEFRDLTDANGLVSNVGDRFAARVVATVPFTILLSETGQ